MHLHTQEQQRLMKAEMSQEPRAGQGEMDELGRGAAAGSLSQAAIPNYVSNNSATAGAEGLAEGECCLNETSLSS